MKFISIIVGLFLIYYLFRPTSKEELKGLKIKIIGQIWVLKKYIYLLDKITNLKQTQLKSKKTIFH